VIADRSEHLSDTIAAAAAGDRAAQSSFIRATRAEVWRLAAALVGRDAADDLTQETYLRALRALPSFKGESGVRTWLFTIVRRACADHLRATARQRRIGVRLLGSPGSREAAPDHAGLLDTWDLLARLDEPRRVAFVLTQVAGLAYAEAAEIEGVPVGTIRSRVARARADLVAAMGTRPAATATNRR
jgi:RNA polymerase sigma-70 factor, ECF subfamily